MILKSDMSIIASTGSTGRRTDSAVSSSTRTIGCLHRARSFSGVRLTLNERVAPRIRERRAAGALSAWWRLSQSAASGLRFGACDSSSAHAGASRKRRVVFCSIRHAARPRHAWLAWHALERFHEDSGEMSTDNGRRAKLYGSAGRMIADHLLSVLVSARTVHEVHGRIRFGEIRHTGHWTPTQLLRRRQSTPAFRVGAVLLQTEGFHSGSMGFHAACPGRQIPASSLALSHDRFLACLYGPQLFAMNVAPVLGVLRFTLVAGRPGAGPEYQSGQSRRSTSLLQLALFSTPASGVNVPFRTTREFLGDRGAIPT